MRKRAKERFLYDGWSAVPPHSPKKQAVSYKKKEEKEYLQFFKPA